MKKIKRKINIRHFWKNNLEGNIFNIVNFKTKVILGDVFISSIFDVTPNKEIIKLDYEIMDKNERIISIFTEYYLLENENLNLNISDYLKLKNNILENAENVFVNLMNTYLSNDEKKKLGNNKEDYALLITSKAVKNNKLILYSQEVFPSNEFIFFDGELT